MTLKSASNKILGTLISNIPFQLIKWTGFGKLVIPYYHIVNNQSVPHLKYLYKYKGTQQFRDDIDFLSKHYSSIGLSEIIAWSKGESNLPPNCFHLTFDDGFREIYDVVAPILLEKGVHGTFFISTAFLDNKELCYQHKASLILEKINNGIPSSAEMEIGKILSSTDISSSKLSEGIQKIDYRKKDTLDRIAEILLIDFQEYLHDAQPYLSTGQVKELLKWGFEIGAHSIDHPYYSALSLDEQLEQTIESIKDIRETFGLKYGAFAFPHHDRGVSDEFFQKIHQTGLVDITFGTGGMLDKGPLNHRQRVTLENPPIPAREILSWQYARRLFSYLKTDK
jgi:peptidoglycan/xylan/chitin deacetylase (PgdA/CDA1 family)